MKDRKHTLLCSANEYTVFLQPEGGGSQAPSAV